MTGWSRARRTLVVFGTGGSSLGGQALAQLGGWFIPGDDRIGKGGRPRLRFYDNLDALSLAKGLEILDLGSDALPRHLQIRQHRRNAEPRR